MTELVLQILPVYFYHRLIPGNTERRCVIGNRRNRYLGGNTFHFLRRVFNYCHLVFPHLPFLLVILFNVTIEGCVHTKYLFLVHFHTATDITSARRRT